MSESIEVRAEATPNPQSMRFVVNRILTDNPLECRSLQETIASPLARKLFGFPWTASVFIGRDFVSVSKQEWVDWETLAEPLADLISEHLERGEPVITDSPATGGSARAATGSPGSIPSSSSVPGSNNESDSETVRRIKTILNEEIRPAVAMDGGDVAFHKYENGVVYLLMQGSCSGCPSATQTLKLGIEARLREAIPEIQEVAAV